MNKDTWHDICFRNLKIKYAHRLSDDIAMNLAKKRAFIAWLESAQPETRQQLKELDTRMGDLWNCKKLADREEFARVVTDLFKLEAQAIEGFIAWSKGKDQRQGVLAA